MLNKMVGIIKSAFSHHVVKEGDDLSFTALQRVARESMVLLLAEIGKDIMFYHDPKHIGEGEYISIQMPFEKEVELSIDRYASEHIAPTMRVLANKFKERNENVVDTFDIAIPKAYQWCYRILIEGMSAMFHIEDNTEGHIIVMTIGIKKTGIVATTSDKFTE
jgi:hypothetical protein